MKKINHLCIGIIALICSACGSSGSSTSITDGVPLISINENELPRKDAKDIIYDLEIIELENHSEASIGQISDMQILDDTIYCYSSSDNGYIVVFDMQGNYIRKIQHLGRARNEWIGALSFFLDKNSRQIVIEDNYGSKILVYDLEGDFLYSLPVEWVHQVAKRGDTIYTSMSPIVTGGEIEELTKYMVNIYSKEGELLSRQVESKYNTAPLVSSRFSEFCTAYNGKLLFVPLMDNTVYEIKGDTVVPYYRFEYNGAKKIITKEELDELFKGQRFTDGDENTVFYGNAFLETPELIYYRMGNDNAVDVIYNKESNESFLTQFQTSSFGKAISKVIPPSIMHPMPHCYYNGRFYAKFSLLRLDLPDEYMQGLPEELEEYAERYRKGELNNLIFTYKIKL